MKRGPNYPSAASDAEWRCASLPKRHWRVSVAIWESPHTMRVLSEKTGLPEIVLNAIAYGHMSVGFFMRRRIIKAARS